VVEDDIRPKRRVMAGRTIGGGKGRARCGVRGIVRLLPGRQMTLRIPAVRGADLQIIVIVDVAVGASRDLARGGQLVGICEREAGGRVIKIGGVPRNGCVASGACGNRKYRGRRGMLRIGRLLPGREMALGIAAIRGRDLQAVIATNVATRAGNIGVAVGKRKIDRRGRVIYGGAKPTVKVVAGLAGLRELRRNVIRICSFLKIGLVTGDAGG